MNERRSDLLRKEEIPCEMCKEKANCCVIWDDPFRPVRELFLCTDCMNIVRDVVCKIIKTKRIKAKS